MSGYIASTGSAGFEGFAEKSECCFCQQDCNSMSQTCGRCARRYTFTEKPKFYWDNDKDNEKDKKNKKKDNIN